jgi:hypothetical protein
MAVATIPAPIKLPNILSRLFVVTNDRVDVGLIVSWLTFNGCTAFYELDKFRKIKLNYATECVAILMNASLTSSVHRVLIHSALD